jgi:hypothetical protein
MFFIILRMCEPESEIQAHYYPYTTNGCHDRLAIFQNRAHFYNAVPLHCRLSLAAGGKEYLL